MDASSVAGVACCSSSSVVGLDEANPNPSPLLLSSSSLPPSHYLQTSPHLLNNAVPVNPTPEFQQQPVVVSSGCQSSRSLDLESSAAASADYRRQSLKSEVSSSSAKILENGGSSVAGAEADLSSTSRSTSSPQLMSVKSRSKVYRRASLKSLTNLSVVSPIQSRIIKVSSRNKSEKRLTMDEDSKQLKDHHQHDKENLECSPLSSPYPYSTPCQKNNKANEKLSDESSVNRDDEKQNNKGKSCGSFLPILSLIPHTVISFQYPSPKMKFSWWRNKIS